MLSVTHILLQKQKVKTKMEEAGAKCIMFCLKTTDDEHCL